MAELSSTKRPRGKPKDPFSRSIPQIAELGQKMVEWFKDENHWWVAEFAAEVANVPMEVFTQDYARKSIEFRKSLELCLAKQEIRYFKLAQEKKIPSQFAIFASKQASIADWRDGRNLGDKKKDEKKQNHVDDIKSTINKVLPKVKK